MRTKTLDYLFILAFLIIGVVIFITYEAYDKLERFNKLVDHSYVVKNKISETESEIRSSILNQRNFLLTKDSIYYEKYKLRIAKTRVNFSDLHSLVIDNKDQINLLDSLIKKYFDREKNLEQELVTFKHNQKLLSGVQMELFNEGNYKSSELLAYFEKMKGEEEKLIVERMSNQVDGQNLAPITFSFLALFAIGIIAFAYFRQKSDLEEKEIILQKKRMLLKRLMSSHEEIEQYTHLTSHQLQEPIRKIRIYLDQALKANENSEKENVGQFLEKIKKLAGQTTVMLTELSNLAYLKPDETDIGLHSFVDILMLCVAEANDKSGLKLKLTIHQPEPPKLLLYPHLIKKLIEEILNHRLLNVGDNNELVALELSYEKVHVENLMWHQISLKYIGKVAEIGAIDKIFEFLQNFKSEENAGKGLAVCKRIMHKHHGFISAENLSDMDATVFKLSFPFEN
ncbi:hypothetical protein EGI22_13530 [Lacihabitans sp. LS3-19]|uniref:CHASE3 domain-containing protein n=1 Tax=Lacihabitans sp. LS3-19 TaxID=2487335 RepID=UPI0020CFDCB3|nr:CHASE3 domain-containing protein [Lacihabitans sp. LS3-19]MCP9768935.1 hypothetical protein [Lacihabitans sp. LS3-19]